MYCPSCGTQLTPEARFCGACGNPTSLAVSSRNATNPAPPQKVVVVAKEGCFLRTLNWGCQTVAFWAGMVVLLVLYASYCQK
jgi:hypothetical protein